MQNKSAEKAIVSGILLLFFEKGNTMKYISFALACTLFTACGTQDEGNSQQTAALTSQAGASTTASSNLDEVMNILSDSDQEGSPLALGLALEQPTKAITRSCVVEGTSAKVDIKSSFSKDAEVKGKFFSSTHTIDMNAEITRIWKKEGASIGCNAALTHADFDPNSDLTGLTTDITFKRTAERSSVRTAKSGVVSTHSVQAITEGSRSITWASFSKNTDNTVVRNKTVSSNATSKRTVVEKDGTSSEANLTLATASAEPLAIEVTFPSETSRDASARTIKTGKLIATISGSGHVESTFDNLKVSFADSSCQPESGSVVNKVFAEGAASPSVIIKIEAASGSYTVTDITDAANPKEIEDFEYQLCDVRDFNR